MLEGFQLTEAQVAEFGMTWGVGGFIVFMLFVIASLAKESKAGKFGTFILFFVRNRSPAANSRSGLAARSGSLARNVRAKRKRANHSFPEWKALRRHRGPRIKTGQHTLSGPAPRSCIRNRSRENLLKRTKIALALPSYDRQRLSGIRRGWCPSRPKSRSGCSVPTLALLTACR